MVTFIATIAIVALLIGLLYWAAASDEDSKTRHERNRVREENAARDWAAKNAKHREE